MSNIEMIDNGIVYDGKKIVAKRKKRGDGYVLNIDGKKMRVSSDQFLLMYAFFSLMYKTYSNEDGDIYGN